MRSQDSTRDMPASAVLHVPKSTARAIAEAAGSALVFDGRDLYATALQSDVYESVRDGCTEEFDWLIDEIRSRLAANPYSVLVRGLNFDPEHRLFVALNRAFGDLVAPPYKKPRAQLVHRIEPSTDRPSVSQRFLESERMHTDCADWPHPARWISMVCVRPDPDGGGKCRLLDADSVCDEIARRLGAEAVETLKRDPVPWQLADYCGGGIAWRPILTDSTVFWRRYTIDGALTHDAVAASVDVPLLDRVERVLNDSSQTTEFLMDPGDFLFLDNHRLLHARTPIGTAVERSRRLMLRSWIREDH